MITSQGTSQDVLRSTPVLQMRVANANFSAPSPSLGSSMDTISGKVNESEPEPDVKMRLIETPQVFSGETSDTVVSNSTYA